MVCIFHFPSLFSFLTVLLILFSSFRARVYTLYSIFHTHFPSTFISSLADSKTFSLLLTLLTFVVIFFPSSFVLLLPVPVCAFPVAKSTFLIFQFHQHSFIYTIHACKHQPKLFFFTFSFCFGSLNLLFSFKIIIHGHIAGVPLALFTIYFMYQCS